MRIITVKQSLLVFIGVVLAVSVTRPGWAAESGDANAAQKEVLTTLEQRMQKTISIEASNLPIDKVIRQLAEQADVNLIISPKVTGQVNVGPLTNVPLAEALKNILSTHGYDYVIDKNMVRVVPASEIAQVTEKLVSRIYRITYADVAEVEKSLQKFISKQGSVSSNPGTSNIMVTDAESKIKAIDTFIEEIDRITPQILVEARIYDITSKDRLDLGVRWEAGTNTIYGADGQPPITHQDRGGNRDPFIASGFAGTTAKTESTIAAIRFGWLNQNIDVDMMLRAQQENIDAKLLANPRVLVLDNEKALIKIISEIPYQELTESAMGGSIGTTAFREVGVELEVTPHLTREDMVRMRLKPKFSVVTGEVTVAGVGVSYPQPVVDRREADTTLLIKNGQTVVLGGLRKKEVTKQINKVPVLGDLPLVGLLFRFTGEDTVTSELVVFITPRIVEQLTMTETEQTQFGTTEFSGPQPVTTGAEMSVATPGQTQD
jgi:type IV pilus assembly protein PilQ